MTQRLKGISDEEATGVVKQIFDTSNQLLGRTAINRLNDSFRTELESEEYNRRQHGAVGVTASALEDYACRICATKEKT